MSQLEGLAKDHPVEGFGNATTACPTQAVVNHKRLHRLYKAMGAFLASQSKEAFAAKG